MKSWQDADKFLRERVIKGISQMHKTYACRIDNEHEAPIHIMYGDVPIVTYYPNGSIKLNTGGHYGRTTKSRLNEFTPYFIQQVKGVWFVTIGLSNGKDVVVPFKDGMTINFDGNVEGGSTLEDLHNEGMFRAEIKAYAAAWAEKFVDGELKGAALASYKGNPDLCRRHIKEKVYSASLAVDAFHATRTNHYYLAAAEGFLRGSKCEPQSRDMYIREYSKMAYKFLCSQLGIMG